MDVFKDITTYYIQSDKNKFKIELFNRTYYIYVWYKNKWRQHRRGEVDKISATLGDTIYDIEMYGLTKDEVRLIREGKSTLEEIKY